VEKRNRIWTWSNGLSFLRVLLIIPVFDALKDNDPWRFVVLALVGVATDFLDGILARRLDQMSDVGRVIDPLADKIAVVGTACFLAFSKSPSYGFPVWFLGFLLVREAAILVCGLIAVRRRHAVMESNRPGKNSAFATAVVIFLYALRWHPVADGMLWLAFFLTLYSTFVYGQRFWKAMRPDRQSES
jgi:CDP-diacylglycerol--glycerol-3-phosphate 3-phosphatidyltransferase